MSDADRVIVPDLGVTGSEVVLVEWLVGEAEFVEAGSPLFSVETDKATVSVEAFRSGCLRRLVPAGAPVAIGSVVAMITDVPEARPRAARLRSRHADRADAKPKSRPVRPTGRKARSASRRLPPSRIAFFQNPMTSPPRF